MRNQFYLLVVFLFASAFIGGCSTMSDVAQEPEAQAVQEAPPEQIAILEPAQPSRNPK